jgi:hypothetical protein
MHVLSHTVRCALTAGLPTETFWSQIRMHCAAPIAVHRATSERQCLSGPLPQRKRIACQGCDVSWLRRQHDLVLPVPCEWPAAHVHLQQHAQHQLQRTVTRNSRRGNPRWQKEPPKYLHWMVQPLRAQTSPTTSVPMHFSRTRWGVAQGAVCWVAGKRVIALVASAPMPPAQHELGMLRCCMQ